MRRRPGSRGARARAYITADPQTMNGHQRAVFLFTGAILAVGALVAVSWVAGFQECWQALLRIHLLPFALAPAVLVVSHVGYTLSYRAVARVADGPDLGPGDATALVMAGFGPFNPRGGFSVDTQGLSRRGHGRRRERPRAALRVLVLGVLEYAVLAPAAWAASLWMLAAHDHAEGGLIPSWAFGVPAGAVATLLAWLVHRRLRRGRPVGDQDGRGFRAIGITLRMAVTWPGGTLAWLGMAIYWAGEIALLGICMAAFAPHRWSVAAAVLAYATGYALTRRTLPLAGAGPVEAIMPFALVWVGCPLPAAVLAVASYRVFNLWLTIPPSALALRRLRRTPGETTPDDLMASGRPVTSSLQG